MFLNADQIVDHRSRSQLGIDPFEPSLLKPVSYVLRLGNKVRRWKRHQQPVDLMSENCSKETLEPVETFSQICIERGELILVSSYESLWLSTSLAGFLSTTSHMSRAGVSVTCDSQLVSPGFGHNAPCEITLEIISQNPSPVILRFGMPVCHLMITPVDPPGQNLPLMRSVYEDIAVPSGPSMFEEMQRIGKPILPSVSE